MQAIISPFIGIVPILIWIHWSKIYRKFFFPKRPPDFEHRLYVYWFDEKVAYSKLADKKKMKFIDHDGVLYEDAGGNNKYLDLFGKETRKLMPEVQKAYKEHIHVKFEEVFLEF